MSDRQIEILTFELAQIRQDLENARIEKKALKEIAVRHLTALEEAQAENRALRESVRLLTADVAHFMQNGPIPPPLVKVTADG